MTDPRKLSYEELMASDPDTLSDAELSRRMNLTQLMKAERETELVASQNEKFQEEKTEKIRRAQSKTIIIEDEQNRIDRERNACRHKTGGKGLPGFFSGDGRQGYSVCTQQLPTKEVYFMCVRCQKEWHLPEKRIVIDAFKKGKPQGHAALEKYHKQEREYFQAAAWDKPLFEGDGGTPGSIIFLIPRLENQRVQDELEFAALIGGEEIAVQ